VMRLASDGQIVWQSQLFTDSPGGTVSKLILDEDGNLAGIGVTNGSPNQTGRSFIFQMDPNTGTLNWGHELLYDFGDAMINDFDHARPGAPYTLVGESLSAGTVGSALNGFILQLATSDGIATGGLRLFFAEGQATFDRIIWQRDRNRFYVSGKQFSIINPGSLVLTFDEMANFTGGSVIFMPDPTNTTNALAQDGVQTIFVTNAATNATGLSRLNVFRCAASGGMELALALQAPTFQLLTNAEVNAAGYLISTLSSSGEVLIQLDRNGNLLWSNSYELSILSSVGFNFHPTDIAPDGGIVLAGNRIDNGANIPAILKLLPDGSSAGNCSPVTPYPISVEPFEETVTNWFGQAEELEIAYVDISWEPLGLEPG
ncbi:MAG: hypothetical protein AAF597_19710, partial [Bacteroidota bacterium]